MPQFTRAIHLRFHFAGTDTTQDDTYDPKIYVKSNWTPPHWTLPPVVIVEKSVFSIWVDLLLCRSIQLLVLSYAEMFVYMYLSQLMSTFTNYLKVHHLLDGIFNP